jgi:hypothetical protein
VRLTHQIGALMVERGVQKETVMLQLEVLIRFPDSTFAERQQLLSLSERADGDRPFFESNRHFLLSRGDQDCEKRPAENSMPGETRFYVGFTESPNPAANNR